MNELNVSGKGVYIWQPNQIFNGNITQIADALQRAHVDFVAIKIHNGSYIIPGLERLFEELRNREIKAGAWGYVYLKWSPLAEAKAAFDACVRYGWPNFYLIDAEAEAKWQWLGAKLFANTLRALMLNMPLGLNSYRFPSVHPELPWRALRSVCDFDAPQIYYRNADPVANLFRSKAEFSRLTPKLPFWLPAGDMYKEFGVRPTPRQVVNFLETCNADKEVRGAVMWSMEQINYVPELWSAFSSYIWNKGSSYIPKPIPIVPEPLYIAVVTAGRGLNVRSGPGISFRRLRTLRLGERVEVWKEQYGWAKIGMNEWVSSAYIKRI